MMDSGILDGLSGALIGIIPVAAMWFFNSRKSRLERQSLKEQNEELRQRNEGLVANNSQILFDQYKKELEASSERIETWMKKARESEGVIEDLGESLRQTRIELKEAKEQISKLSKCIEQLQKKMKNEKETKPSRRQAGK